MPAPGVITSWSFQDVSTLSGLRLKVASGNGGTSYTIVADAAAGAQMTNAVNTYPEGIPVQAGEVIGFSFGGGADCGGSGMSSDTYASAPGDQALGTTTSYAPGSGVTFPLSVQITLQPGVALVSPTSGPPGGGTQVTITGHDFTGATAVSFGGTPAASFTVTADTSITATAPAGAGSVDVTVTTPGGQSPTSSADKFTYSTRPVVASVSPASGPRTGGAEVTIAGNWFAGATQVSFGSQAARSFTVNSDTRITAVAPAGSVGTVDVTVTTASGQSATSAGDRFAFVQVCVVPKLKGKKLKAARKALEHAHCGVGKVKGPPTGRVKHQSQKPGTVLPAGTKVKLKLA